ncbi:UdgX family uracil-DNA binding protein [Roseomonas sp. NAR14]|uniref:Type-4 uracil-DNA glycosylase n=1 Tax=Roseomonas acroporae TaxID=2937791 RepID=A0A9X1YC71_9PROT|nr:UdgX family uracil-DNA binding protein [Roseomonas acroporae]MCK8787072.1 UdgX family uracil-DNA binding protein [Roseomonas acroporae]
MIRALLDGPTDHAGWRRQARALALAGVPPERVEWSVAGDTPGLFPDPVPPAPAGATLTVPRGFPPLAETVSRHRDPERFALLYGLLWRLRESPGLLAVATDPAVARAEAMARAVRRDAHKLHAFLRFREIATPDGPRFVGWFEPDHHILEAEAGFFVRRFATMRWSILTPRRSAHWDGEALALGPGGRRADAPAEDAREALWLAYYASIFNPARLKPAAMRAEMPRKYWRNLPEAALIPRLIAEAPGRVAAMVARGVSPPVAARRRAALPGALAPTPAPAPAPAPASPSGDAACVEASAAMVAMPIVAAPGAPPPAGGGATADSLSALREAALGCRACPLWKPATQMVFGEGVPGAPLMFVGEQPGDAEDLRGRPFVGPAGRLWNRALAEAGVDRAAAYVTNSVKHFKFTPTGRRRLHQRPDAGEVQACRPWLHREIALVAPRLVVALGATALNALTGHAGALGPLKGEVVAGRDGVPVLVTVHPSYLLRLPDPAARAAEYAGFVAALRRAAELAGVHGEGMDGRERR